MFYFYWSILRISAEKNVEIEKKVQQEILLLIENLRKNLGRW